MKQVFVRFMAPVMPQTVDALLKVVDEKIHDKCEKLHLLLSSPGGSVFHGLSVYNFLCGAPIEVHTYNFGSVDSIGVVMYCAGTHRYCVPHARFLIHGVRMNFQGNASFDEFQISEQLKQVKIDQDNIARVIADTCKKPLHSVQTDMHDRRTLSPTEAKDYGLTHEIKSELLPVDAEFISIDEKGTTNKMHVVMNPPQASSFTRSVDIDVVTM